MPPRPPTAECSPCGGPCPPRTGEAAGRQQRLRLLHEKCLCSQSQIIEHADGDRLELICAPCGRHQMVYLVRTHH